jgi:hypothetical protein
MICLGRFCWFRKASRADETCRVTAAASLSKAASEDGGSSSKSWDSTKKKWDLTH